jgi:hypothetical protein
LSFAWRDTSSRIHAALYDKHKGPDVLGALLDPAHEVQVVAHNAAFDAGVYLTTKPRVVPFDPVIGAGDFVTYWDHLFDAYRTGRVTCTEVREKLIAIAEGRANRFDPPTGLASCAKRYLDERIVGKGPDKWRLRYHELDGVPLEDWPEAATEYAILDAVYCLRVYEAQSRTMLDMIGSESIPDEAPQVRKAFSLGLKAARGFRCEPERVELYETELVERVEYSRPILEGVGLLVGATIKEDKSKQAVCDAYDAHGLGLPPLTDTGKKKEKDKKLNLAHEDLVPQYASCAGDVLRDVPCLETECDDDGPCAELLHVLAWRQDAARELSKYAKHLRRATVEVVNPRMSAVLATGRCSASKPPYQQFPRRPGARECVIPRPGYVFAGADYSANELVALAQILIDSVGFSALADLLRSGVDPHLYVAAKFLEISYEEAERRKDAGDKVIADTRQLMKAADFGFPGGMGPKAFVDYAWSSWGVKVTIKRAAALKRWWLNLFPEIRDYFAIISQRCAAGGGSFDLEQPYSGRLRGSVGYCDGCNSNFQGLAADATGAALWRVTDEAWLGVDGSRAGALYDSRAVLFMHDEIIVEAPEATAHEAAERLGEIMVEELVLRCPDVAVACKAEPWLAKRWSKNAKPLWGEDGRLVPWDG